MIVQVKEIPVRHGGQRYLAGEEFKIDQKHYEKIEKFVEIVDDSEDDQEPKSTEEMTVPQLKDFAEEKGIDLEGATKRDEILTIIQAALKE